MTSITCCSTVVACFCFGSLKYSVVFWQCCLLFRLAFVTFLPLFVLLFFVLHMKLVHLALFFMQINPIRYYFDQKIVKTMSYRTNLYEFLVSVLIFTQDFVLFFTFSNMSNAMVLSISKLKHTFYLQADCLRLQPRHDS